MERTLWLKSSMSSFLCLYGIGLLVIYNKLALSLSLSLSLGEFHILDKSIDFIFFDATVSSYGCDAYIGCKLGTVLD